MNELEKCMAGECYDCPNEVFLEYKNTARNLLAQYNSFTYNQKEEKAAVLKQLFGSIRTNVSVGLPYYMRLWEKHSYTRKCFNQYELYICRLQ